MVYSDNINPHKDGGADSLFCLQAAVAAWCMGLCELHPGDFELSSVQNLCQV